MPVEPYDETASRIDEVQEIKQSDRKLKIGIGNQAGFILISFNGPTERIMMSKKDAKEFARRIIQESLK